MKKEVVEIGGKIKVYIKDADGSIILIQPFNPKTGLPFVNKDEANRWADEMIALMSPSAEAEEDISMEG